MRKFFTLLLVVFLSIALIGCATLFKPKNAVVGFSSDPEGANVYIDGYDRGRTPIQIKLSHKKPVTITFKKQGYEDKTYVINTKVGAGWVILDCLGGFIPVIIDAVTGNWSSLDETDVRAILEVERR